MSRDVVRCLPHDPAIEAGCTRLAGVAASAQTSRVVRVYVMLRVIPQGHICVCIYSDVARPSPRRIHCATPAQVRIQPTGGRGVFEFRRTGLWLWFADYIDSARPIRIGIYYAVCISPLPRVFFSIRMMRRIKWNGRYCVL